MSKLMRSNIVHTMVWLGVVIGLIVIFSMSGTVQNWGDERIKIVVLASLFLIGFIIDFVLRILEKSQKHGYAKDERDDKIQSDAIFKSFAVVLMYVFILSITLYLKYESRGTLPVGWMWFIAYTTIAAANLFVGMFSIIGYKNQGL